MFGHIILCLLFGEETLEDGSTKTLDLVVVIVVAAAAVVATTKIFQSISALIITGNQPTRTNKNVTYLSLTLVPGMKDTR